MWCTHTHLRVNTIIYILYILYTYSLLCSYMLLSKGVEPARTRWKWFPLKGTLTHWVRTYWNYPTWVHQKWSPKHTKTSSSLVQSKFTSSFHSKLRVNSCQFHVILSSFCTMSSFQPRKKKHLHLPERYVLQDQVQHSGRRTSSLG